MGKRIDVVNVSTKGQIVLPASIRKSLGIKEGDRLLVLEQGGYITMKVLKMPTLEEFEKLHEENVKMVQEAGLTEEDIRNIIKEVRAEKK